MEGIQIYEQSYDQIKLIMKSIGLDTLVIDFKKLDTETSGKLRVAISEVLSERAIEVAKVITNDSLN